MEVVSCAATVLLPRPGCNSTRERKRCFASDPYAIPDSADLRGTLLAPVAETASQAGANWINDVSGGGRDPTPA